ncbi:hypothetical protein PR202_ga12569 [Eleusine coracana subsp. coracana]|uniref:Uncharacterized protein n=1 Tax=Eleusine coracana subsp. coracana TaxID=191504 RepID=A0AAV5CCF8_ELECO|nr:hypothetical protein PR202_ga12569 [Eleusine coracana subsp. coracana]
MEAAVSTLPRAASVTPIRWHASAPSRRRLRVRAAPPPADHFRTRPPPRPRLLPRRALALVKIHHGRRWDLGEEQGLPPGELVTDPE